MLSVDGQGDLGLRVGAEGPIKADFWAWRN